MATIDRRQFVRRSAAAAGLMALPSIIPSGIRTAAAGAVPPGRRIAMGLIGKGVMGSGHLRRLAGDPSIQLVAVCDVDTSRREAGVAQVKDVYAARGAGSGCKAYSDYRELLARPDIDAVVIVTPDHWHALQAIDAAKAGKDVYCEKPVSINIREGRQIVDAVRRHGRVFQTGTQYRSIPTIRRVCQFIREGGLGKVKAVFTILDPVTTWLRQDRFRAYSPVIDAESYRDCYTAVDAALPGEPTPAGLDWDMWVGPAPWREYNRLYHSDAAAGVVPWSFSDAFGVASITWHLSHSTDVIQYALGTEESGPVEIIHPVTGQYPTLTCRYAGGTLLHFVDHWGMVRDLYGAVPAGARLAGLFGGVFVGERGWLTSMSTGGPIEGGPAEIFKEMALPTRQVNIGSNDHHANWLDCIRNRGLPSCHEEIGHRSASLGHLAMIAYKLRRSLRWDPVNEQFASEEAANRLRGRALRGPWHT